MNIYNDEYLFSISKKIRKKEVKSVLIDKVSKNCQI